MAVDSLGAKRQPQFLDGGAPDIAVDPTAVADYAAYVGNRIVGTTAERTTATSWAWPMMEWADTTDNAIYTFIGGGWLPRDVTPQVHAATFNNLTVGNGSVAATYQRLGKAVHCQGSVKLGSTSAMGSSPQLVLPYAGIAKYAVAGSNYILGQTGMLDRGAAFYAGLVFTQASAAWVQLAAQGGSGAQVSITGTSPFAWSGAANDELSWDFWYEAA